MIYGNGMCKRGKHFQNIFGGALQLVDYQRDEESRYMPVFVTVVRLPKN